MRLRLPSLLTNRVILGAIAFFVLVGLWEFRWKPQYRPHYEVGVAHYQAARYQQALDELRQAYEIAPNSLDVILMLGWAHYKVNQFEDARFFFDRALRINPATAEAQLGSAFVALETGRGTLDVDLIRQYLGSREGDPGVRILSAGALAKDGRWFEAAAIYRGLLGDRDYGQAARLALADIFGTAATAEPPAVTGFPPVERPTSLQVGFWAGDGGLWQRRDSDWQRLYVAGVNFGAAPPGFYPSRQVHDLAQYAEWVGRAAALEANVIRAYNLLPPAFYRAFRAHRDSGGALVLLQQIYVGEPPGRDLFDEGFVDQTRASIRHVVDAIHGRGEVPSGPGRRGGLYDQPVADAVAGFLLGRELEPSVVAQTNLLNAGERRHAGRYVRLDEGTATEVWVARMLDYLVEYETQTYNHQRPVAFVNWPSLDAFTHPTEAPILQELRVRLARGEQDLELPSGPQDDDDVVSLDEAKLVASSEFVGGLFAAYHVFPHWPAFLANDPGLLATRDRDGPNPVLGYLQRLAARVRHPLVVAEYGASSAMGIGQLHPLGWHQGGLDERQQAALLARLTRTVREANTAGGLVFSLHDEWYKRHWLVRRFQEPEDRGTLWLNELNADQRYGLYGFRPRKWKLFTGDAGAWQNETVLHRGSAGGRTAEDPFAGARALRQVQAAADEAFLYVRLAVDCLDCSARDRRADGRPRFDKASYALAINTQPGTLGAQTLPWNGPSMPSGANVLVLLTDEPAARLLVAGNYNPYEVVATPGIPTETDLRLRYSIATAIVPRAPFTEVTVEPNRRRYTRDGRQMPPQRISRGPLRYGIDDPASAAHDSHAEWYAEPGGSALVARIPWGKLLVTDPSGRTVFAGFDDRRVRTARTDGIEIAAFALVPLDTRRDVEAFSVAAALPAVVNGVVAEGPRFTWETWDTVAPEAYAKPAVATLRDLFAEIRKAATGAGAGPGGRARETTTTP